MNPVLSVTVSLSAVPISVIVHEAGHALMALALGAKGVRVEIRRWKFATHLGAQEIRRSALLAIILAGPGVNLLAGALSAYALLLTWRVEVFVWTLVNIGMFVGNLVPFKTSDGQMLLDLFRAEGGPSTSKEGLGDQHHTRGQP